MERGDSSPLVLECEDLSSLSFSSSASSQAPEASIQLTDLRVTAIHDAFQDLSAGFVAFVIIANYGDDRRGGNACGGSQALELLTIFYGTEARP
jgi:hypothetical protein